MGDGNGAGQFRPHQSIDETQPSSLVAPLDTHGLLSDSNLGSHDSDIGAQADQGHNLYNVNPLRTTASPPSWASNDPSTGIRSRLGAAAISLERKPELEQSITSASRTFQYSNANDESFLRHTASPTSTTSRNYTHHGSISQHEPLIIDEIPTEHNVGGVEKRSTKATTPVASYPPISEPNITRVRKYKKLEQQQLQDTSFFLRGHLMTGGDNIWPLIGSIVLVLGLGGLWLGTTGVWIWREGLGGGGAGRGGKAAVIIFGYLLGVCFGAMIATAFRDPGELFARLYCPLSLI